MKFAAPAVAATLAAMGLAAMIPAAWAQAPALTIKPVKPGLYMIVGAGGNMLVRTTPAGLIVVDTKNSGQDIYDAIMAQIRTVSSAPVKYVVDTHHHADHTGNNKRFMDAGAQVIGNEGIKPGLAAYRKGTNPVTAAIVDPAVFFTDAKTIEVGGAKAELHHYSRAHTGGDTLVYFPDLKAVALGDEVALPSPTFDFPGGGDIEGWENSLDQVMKLDWDVAIPGHGENPIGKADVAAFRGKLAIFLARAREQVKAGIPKDQLIDKIRIDDLGWKFAPGFWAAANRVDGLYAEASK
jgi:cyclase